MTTPTDAALLARYLHDRDDAAFAAIVRKHGPMVFGACRRITAHHHDAEDAFQAAFLVLAARAETVRPRERLGAWLHGVAVRCARKARDSRRRLGSSDSLPEPAVLPSAVEPDLPPLIDDALAAIPDSYRAAVVLCHLEGRSRSEAARELGWSEGTLSGRLHRALKLLERRLTARGVTATGAALLAVLSARTASASVPAALSGSTCSAASLLTAGFAEPAGPAATLAHGVMRTMSFRKLKLTTAVLLGVMGIGSFAVMKTAEAKSTDARVVRRNAPVPKGECKQEWKQVLNIDHGVRVTAVAGNGKMIATAGGDKDLDCLNCDLKLWDSKTGKPLALPVRGAVFTRPADTLRFVSSDQYLMMAAPGGGIFRYEQRAGGLVGDLAHGGYVLGFADDLSVSVARDSRLPNTKLTFHTNLWEVPNAAVKPVCTVGYAADQAVQLAALSPDGKRIVVANADLTVRVYGYDGKAVTEEHTITQAEGTKPTVLKLSDDGKRLAVIGEKGFARVFDADNGAELCELKGHDGTVNAVAFTPDGSQVATANGKVVRVFDAKSGKQLGEIKGHDDEVTCLAFAADGKRLVTGSKDKTAKVWEVK